MTQLCYYVRNLAFDPLIHFRLSFTKLVSKKSFTVTSPLESFRKQGLPDCLFQEFSRIIIDVLLFGISKSEVRFYLQRLGRIIKEATKMLRSAMKLNCKFTKKTLPFILMITAIG